MQLTVTQVANCDTPTDGTQIFNGTINQFATSATGFGTGVGSWATAGNPGESLGYLIKYTFAADAPNTTQGGAAALGFVWEAQNK